jgi:hypothetical protein
MAQPTFPTTCPETATPHLSAGRFPEASGGSSTWMEVLGSLEGADAEHGAEHVGLSARELLISPPAGCSAVYGTSRLLKVLRLWASAPWRTSRQGGAAVCGLCESQGRAGVWGIRRAALTGAICDVAHSKKSTCRFRFPQHVSVTST